MRTICTCSGSKILMKGEIDSYYFKYYTLSTSVNSCLLQPYSQTSEVVRGPFRFWLQALFSTERLKIFKCTLIKRLLETNFVLQWEANKYFRSYIPMCKYLIIIRLFCIMQHFQDDCEYYLLLAIWPSLLVSVSRFK